MCILGRDELFGGLLHQAPHLSQYAYITGCSEPALYSQTALFIQNSWSLVEGGTEERHLGKQKLRSWLDPTGVCLQASLEGSRVPRLHGPRAGHKGGFVKRSHALSIHLLLSLSTVQGLTSLMLRRGMSRPTRNAP